MMSVVCALNNAAHVRIIKNAWSMLMENLKLMELSLTADLVVMTVVWILKSVKNVLIGIMSIQDTAINVHLGV